MASATAVKKKSTGMSDKASDIILVTICAVVLITCGGFAASGACRPAPAPLAAEQRTKEGGGSLRSPPPIVCLSLPRLQLCKGFCYLVSKRGCVFFVGQDCGIILLAVHSFDFQRGIFRYFFNLA